MVSLSSDKHLPADKTKEKEAPNRSSQIAVGADTNTQLGLVQHQDATANTMLDTSARTDYDWIDG